MSPNHARAELPQRLPRLVFGLVLCGWGIAAGVASDLGLGPWDVLHQGLSRNTGIPIGMMAIIVGMGVLGLWWPLKERPGVGTVLNVLIIGITIDITLLWLHTPESLSLRIALMIAGPLLFGIGSGFYLGVGLGSGPRDGIMTGLARRGWPVGIARATVELSVLVIGYLLGGTVGFGTVLFAVTIGPLVHWFLPRLRIPDADPAQTPALGVRSAR